MYTLILVLAFLSPAGPQEIVWKIPNLPQAVCEVMAEESKVNGTLPASIVLVSGTQCKLTEQRRKS